MHASAPSTSSPTRPQTLNAPELRQAYADRDTYLVKLDAYATQMVDKPIALGLGAVAVTAATAGTGTVAAGYFGLTGWGAFGAGVVTDGVAAGNGGLFYRPMIGQQNSFRSYGTDVLIGAGTGGVLRGLGSGVSWSVGKIGNSGSIAAETAFNAKQAAARSFYEAAGWSDAKIASHMAGIDFNYPVDVVSLPQGETLVQHMVPGSRVGNYFAPEGTSASQLGINPAGRIPTLFSPNADVQVLRSTAAPITDTWTVPGTSFRASGGGTQYFTRNPGNFSRIP